MVRAFGVRGFEFRGEATFRRYPPHVRHFAVHRHLTEAQLADVHALVADAERADGARPLSDHLWLDLRQGGRSGFGSVIATEVGHSHIVAYCQVSRGNDSWALEMIIHPHHRYDTAEIGPELLRHALSVVAEEGGGHVHWWVFEPSQMHHDMARAAGLSEGRRLLQLRCTLPLSKEILARRLPLSTRPFRPGVDDAQWLEVNNAAFADHPEQGGWSQETLDARKQEPWFDPEGFVMHHIDDHLAAFCWTKMHRDTQPVLGEIYVIAVNPVFSGRHLGTQLAIAGLEHLTTTGAEMGMLFVDADNRAAMAMYTSLGFFTHHVERAFVGDIAAA